MKNLKRVLSLALSGVMLVGMMTVGASAVDFKDTEDITHLDAVTTLVGLNVINGKDDGSFDPNGNVKRGEMAKMISMVMNGGKDVNVGAKGNPTFSDIKGHWAESYIEYCHDLGIINGRGDGTFDPDAEVTGLEVTKMVLTAMGYASDAYLLTGDSWASKTDELARKVQPESLYDDLDTVVMRVAATRDTAAQLIWNGLQGYVVRYSPETNTSNGEVTWGYHETNESLLHQRYNASVVYGYMTAFKWNDDDNNFTYTVDAGTDKDETGLFGGKFPKDVTVADGDDYTFAEDVTNLFGQKIKVVVRNNKDKEVLGVFASDSSVLATAVVGSDLDLDPDDSSVKIDGKTYSFKNANVKTDADEAQNIPVYLFGKADSVGSLSSYRDGANKTNLFYTANLIDNDDDGKVNCAVVTPISVGKVTYVGKTSITANNAVYKFDDCDIYEDVAKDDYAIITASEYTAKDRATLVKATKSSGELESIRKNGDNDSEMEFDGNYYVDVRGDLNLKLNESYDYVAVNGYLFDAEKTSGGVNAEDVVVVTAADPVTSGNVDDDSQYVKLMFSDGSKRAVYVVSIGDDDVSAKNSVSVGELYTYSVDKNGDYELSTIDPKEYDKDDSFNTATTVDDGKMTVDGTTYRFNDDAVIFVHAAKGNEWDVVTGKIVNDWDKRTDATGIVFANNSDGFSKIEVGYFSLADAEEVPGKTGDTKYGWITGKPARVKIGDDYFFQFTVWNGEEDFTALAESVEDPEETGKFVNVSSSTTVSRYNGTIAKGTPVTYKDLGDNHINKVASLKGTADAVTAYTTNGKYVGFAKAGELKITDDTKIVYVNTADNEGVTGGSIQIAQDTAAGNYVNNVYVAQDTDSNGADNGEVKYLIVDTGNNLDENKGFDKSKKGKPGAVVASIDDQNNMTVKSGKTIVDLVTELTAWGDKGSATVAVFKSAGVVDAEPNDSTDPLAAGMSVVVSAQNGDTESYTILDVE